MLLRAGTCCSCPRSVAPPRTRGVCLPGLRGAASALHVLPARAHAGISVAGPPPLLWCTATGTQPPQRPLHICCSKQKDAPSPAAGDDGQTVVSIGIGLLWLCLAVYGFMLSPNQTPYRDQIFIKLLTGISQDSTFSVNPVYFSVFNIIGIYTFIYQCLLIPGGRSANKIPAWPFVVLSYGLGAFALLPYFALWRPDKDLKLPLKPEELEGWNKLGMKGAETKVLPGIALAAALYLIYNAATASGAAWAGYVSLFEESRLVHVSTIDCAILTCLCPFWMSNDAELRDWKDRDKLLPLLSVLPVVGPATYLLLRPKTGEEQQK